MNISDAISQRSSTKKFADTAVDRAQIEALLAAAGRAPDHGLLAPWRFIVLQGDRRAVLGDAMRLAFLEKWPDADFEAQERERSKAFRSPVLIVVSACVQAHPKVPEIEQCVAVGAAIQNLWLAAIDAGLGLAWKTGSHAYHPGVKKALGLALDDHIIGFLHVGVPMAVGPIRATDFESRTRWL